MLRIYLTIHIQRCNVTSYGTKRAARLQRGIHQRIYILLAIRHSKRRRVGSKLVLGQFVE